MSHLVLAREVRGELEVKRSRFLTVLQRVETEDAARAVVTAIRAEHPQARHHCTAFVIGPRGDLQRTNDDGEPSGTAGAPMLEALLAAGVSDVVAVVVRYFGGVLLGAGGLTRAYRGAVAQTLVSAPLLRRELRERLEVELDYAQAHQLDTEAARVGWAVEHTYGERVRSVIAVPPGDLPALEAVVATLTAGATRPVSLPAHWVDVAT